MSRDFDLNGLTAPPMASCPLGARLLTVGPPVFLIGGGLTFSGDGTAVGLAARVDEMIPFFCSQGATC